MSDQKDLIKLLIDEAMSRPEEERKFLLDHIMTSLKNGQIGGSGAEPLEISVAADTRVNPGQPWADYFPNMDVINRTVNLSDGSQWILRLPKVDVKKGLRPKKKSSASKAKTRSKR